MVERTWPVAIAVLAVTAAIARAEPVSAVIVDGTTGKPVRNATVSVDGTTPLAVTGKDGRFAVEVAPDATLIVMADGYEPALVAIADARGEIALLPLGVASEMIEVEDEAPPGAPGATRLDRDEIEHIPGARGDVIAGLDALPGVTSAIGPGPPAAGVVIRGAAPEDSRILVDGFEIPLLYHIGLRSIIPTAAIAGLEYLPGGFDVAYGRASSGIVSVTTRGGERRLGGQAETSVIDGGLLGHGPVGDNGTFLVAVRRSVIDLVLPSLLPDDAGVQLTTVPRYWDGQARLDYELSTRWKTAVSVIGTSDVLELIADDEADADRRFFAETRFVRAIADARYHHGAWSANVAASGITQGTHFEFGRSVFFRADRLGGTVRGELAHSSPSTAGLTDVVTRVGAEVDVSRWTLDMAAPALEDEGEPEAENGPPMDPATFFDGTVWVPDLAMWSAISASLSPKIRVTTGLRVDGFVRTRDVAVQPRGELAYAATPSTKLRLVAGAYRRPAEYLTELLDRSLDPEKATQTVLGVEQTIAAGIKVQGSVYYTDRARLLTRADDGGFDNQGRGTTYGAELLATLRRGPWFGFVSYALSRSTRRDRPDVDDRLFDHDQPHDLNLAATWKSGKWQIGGRFTYTSGQPTTEVMGAFYDSDGDRYIPIYGAINAVRLPGHHQLDIRIDRSWKAGGMKLTGFLDVANVYYNAPVVGREYSFDYTEQVTFKGLPILPSIGLRGEL
jgi:outer membrane receptor protein involved in Fe transport